MKEKYKCKNPGSHFQTQKKDTQKHEMMKIAITEFCTNTFMRENTNTYIYTKYYFLKIQSLAELNFISCLHSFIKPALEELFRKKMFFFPGSLLLSNYSFYRYNYFYIYFYFYFHFYLHLLVASMLRLTELVTRLNAQFLILQLLLNTK